MNYIIPLGFTIIIELAVVLLLGFRTKKFILLVIIANILTNPSLNVLVQHYYFTFLQILCLEFFVTVIEALFLKYTYKENLPYFRLSFIMNALSFLIGLWFPWDLIRGL